MSLWHSFVINKYLISALKYKYHRINVGLAFIYTAIISCSVAHIHKWSVKETMCHFSWSVNKGRANPSEKRSCLGEWCLYLIYLCLFIDLMWLFPYFSQTPNFLCILNVLGFASFLWADMLTDCEPPDILSSPQWKHFSALHYPGGLAFDGRWKNTSVLSDFTWADENKISCSDWGTYSQLSGPNRLLLSFYVSFLNSDSQSF